MLQVSNTSFKNFLGRLLMVVFGLTIFFEVAVLPWASACVVNVEKTLVAGLDELDEKETEKNLDFGLLIAPMVSLLLAIEFQSAAAKDYNKTVDQVRPYADATPIFIVQRSIRV